MKSEIINLRRKIYNNLKKKALSYEGGHSKELKTYQKDQLTYSQRPFGPSDIEELTSAVKKSRTIFLGDFHTFDQNIRNVLRILKVIVQSSNNCLIALEMVDSKYQFYIDTYLEGHLTDLEFLESIDYHESWRFPWSHYKLIFELAKEHQIKIIGINTQGNLTERDNFAAKLINNTLKNYINTQILVVYGELHITPNKIPNLIIQNEDHSMCTIIHQNLDEVYWKQIEENQTYKIVKFNEHEYCINSAPPWIKYESMIYWYENLCDDPDFDIHEYIIENGKKIFSDDTKDNFFHICEEMIKAIKIDFQTEELEDFNLHDHTNLELIEDKIIELQLPEIQRFYQELIEKGYSFRLPNQRTFYCSSYSMNRIAYLAGIHIYHYFLENSGLTAIDLLKSGDKDKIFAHFAFESLYAYFFSKVINPHRKCEMYIDLRNNQSKTDNEIKKSIYKVATEALDENSISHKFEDFSLFSIFNCALYVGHILGEYLYENVFHKDQTIYLEKDFLNSLPDNFSFQRIKRILLKDIPYKNHQKRYF